MKGEREVGGEEGLRGEELKGAERGWRRKLGGGVGGERDMLSGGRTLEKMMGGGRGIEEEGII